MAFGVMVTPAPISPEGPGLLKDAHRHAEMLERQSGRQAADPGPDDRDRGVKISCGRS